MCRYILWNEWVQAFSALRGAFSRQTTFLLCMVICAGMTVRTDCYGIASLVSALGLSGDRAYHALLRFFQSSAVCRATLVRLWLELCLKIFNPMCVNGRLVLICDAIKIPKEGRKMPGVKALHQESSSNSKAEFIMGHYIQAVSLGVVGPSDRLASIPLVGEIHDGIIRTHRGAKSCVQKMAGLNNKLS